MKDFRVFFETTELAECFVECYTIKDFEFACKFQDLYLEKGVDNVLYISKNGMCKNFELGIVVNPKEYID